MNHPTGPYGQPRPRNRAALWWAIGGAAALVLIVFAGAVFVVLRYTDTENAKAGAPLSTARGI